MWRSVVDELEARCAPTGLDLVQPFVVEAYNRAVDPAYVLPDFGRPGALGILIGNTRSLWPPFLAAMRSDPSRLDGPNPLDQYCAAAVREATRALPHPVEIRGAHERPPRRVAMQRLAHVCGLAHLSPSHLSIHPTYGPWIALRAAVVVDVDGPAATPQPRDPCADCARDCMPRFRDAVAQTSVDDPGAAESTWRAWLAVRDACPVGTAHRYDDGQIRYHYTKDPAVLRAIVEDTER